MGTKYTTLQGNILATSYPLYINNKGLSSLVAIFYNKDIYGLVFIYPLLENTVQDFMDFLSTKNTSCSIQIVNTPGIKTKTLIDVWITTDTVVFSGAMLVDTEEVIKKEYLKLTLLK